MRLIDADKLKKEIEETVKKEVCLSQGELERIMMIIDEQDAQSEAKQEIARNNLFPKIFPKKCMVCGNDVELVCGEVNYNGYFLGERYGLPDVTIEAQCFNCMTEYRISGQKIILERLGKELRNEH